MTLDRAGQLQAQGGQLVRVGDDVHRFDQFAEALGVDWVVRPATQPGGSRSMIFKDPEGNLVNVFSRP